MNEPSNPESTIPPYTPERAYNFRRQRESVRRKIALTCDVPELAGGYQKSLDGMATRSLDCKEWNVRVADCAKHCGVELTTEKRGEINAVARQMMVHLLDGRELTERATQHVAENGYVSIVANSLTEAYVNHVTREALSQFKSCGFSDKSAFALCGGVIKKAVAGTYQDSFAVYPIKNPELSAAQNIYRVEHYWEGVRDMLNENHREEKRGKLARTPIR